MPNQGGASLNQCQLKSEQVLSDFSLLSTWSSLKIGYKLDLESIGSSLGINWELIWSGVEWSGPAIRPGLDNRHLIIEGHRGLRRW